jgi:hypothetical protein
LLFACFVIATVGGKECLLCKAVEAANICVDIKECSSMPHSFAYAVFVNGHGTLTASCIDQNNSSTVPNWFRYKLYVYEALGVGYSSYFRIMVQRSAVVPKTTGLPCLCINGKIIVF